MRSTFWRLMLALLLAVALPLQGYAAHGLHHCAPVPPTAPGVDAHAHHAPAPEASPHEHAGHHLEVAGPDGHSDLGKTHGETQGKTQGTGKCSACASCCSGLALIPGLPLLDLPAQGPLAVATVPPSPEGLRLGGLDRPPQSLLA